MPDLLIILWLPITTAVMAIAWVLALGAIATQSPSEDAPRRSQGPRRR